jgi:hypothetical protein
MFEETSLSLGGGECNEGRQPKKGQGLKKENLSNITNTGHELET